MVVARGGGALVAGECTPAKGVPRMDARQHGVASRLGARVGARREGRGVWMSELPWACHGGACWPGFETKRMSVRDVDRIYCWAVV